MTRAKARPQDLLIIVKELRAKNPYPTKLFPEKTKKDWERVHKALDKAGIIMDGYSGCWGRMVWDGCCNRLEDIIKEKNENRGSKEKVMDLGR